jgi:hypothetical protein
MLPKIVLAAMAALVPATSFATLNATGEFVVTGVITSTDSDEILVTVSAPPTHPTCNAKFFALSASLPADRRKAILARLLTAKLSGESITLGYDATGECTEGGYIRLHRVG